MVKFRVKEVSPVQLLETYKPDEIRGHCENCENHGKVWSCPPIAFDPKDFFNRFKHAYVLIGEVPLMGFDSMDESIAHYYAQRRNVNRAMLVLEQAIPGSVSLFAGRCESCDECTRANGLECDKPELCRYSLESLGLKVSDILETHFGEKLQWAEGTVPDKLLTVPALLSPVKIDPAQLLGVLTAAASG